MRRCLTSALRERSRPTRDEEAIYARFPKPFTLTHLYAVKLLSPNVKLVFIYTNMNRGLEEFSSPKQAGGPS